MKNPHGELSVGVTLWVGSLYMSASRRVEVQRRSFQTITTENKPVYPYEKLLP